MGLMASTAFGQIVFEPRSSGKGPTISSLQSAPEHTPPIRPWLIFPALAERTGMIATPPGSLRLYRSLTLHTGGRIKNMSREFSRQEKSWFCDCKVAEE
jgi:hypothetical protein